MSEFTEKSLVEDYIINKLEEKGWKFVHADNLERVSYEEPLLISSLSRNIGTINEKSGTRNEEINKVINILKLTGTGFEGAKSILNYYKFGIPIKFEKEKTVKYVKLFDFQNTDNNEFIVSRQVYYQGRDLIRVDIVLYINGIPVANIECKNPLIVSENWHTAYKQIIDYQNTIPELYKYIQIGVAAEATARYFPIVTWKEEVLTHMWHCEGKDAIDSAIEMLSCSTILDIIQNYIFFRTEREEASKIICRYMQYAASNKIVKRVEKNLAGEEQKNKGLIWHWQGSGKTFTMIFAANKLYYLDRLENPSIFFIVDRIELERQLSDEFNFLDMEKPEIIDKVATLKRILKYDDYRGKRGIFITLIHKFKPEELSLIQKELEEISKNKDSIMNRKNVIVFIDEGHRTQYGLLAAQMKSIFKSAFFFAFTGTPISRKERDTYLEFSYPPDELYLDKYFIADSIKDGFTVKMVYQPRLTEEVHLKKDMLESFLASELEELPEDIGEKVEEKIKEKLNTIKVVLENQKRIGMIAKDISEHFKENVDGKFKAMVVATSRIACDRYKKELDKFLPSEYSEIVMTYNRSDRQELTERVAEMRVRFGTKDIGDVRKDIVDKYKDEDYPKILIVTDMLLTGFDAPELQVMYLDKPLKEHRLLQAIARTNRPYKNLKEAGIIIDYVGVLGEIKKAFKIYNEEDIKCVLFSYENVEEEFKDLIDKILKMFEKLPKNYDRETLLKAIELLTTEKINEREFVGNYKNLRKIFELLGSKEIKIEYLEDYKWISAIYTYYMKIVNQEPPIEDYIEKYFDKTIKFIHQSTEIKSLETRLPEVSFDQKYLEELEEKIISKKEQAANILFALNKMVLVDKHKNPIYESLVERVERLLELWKEKTKDYQRIYSEGKNIINEINSLSSRQKNMGFSDLEYSLLLVLEEKFGKKDELLNQIKDISNKLKDYLFPGWFNQPTEEKRIEREVRKFSRGLKRKYGVTLEEMDELYKKLIEQIKNYGTK
ncbi:MAG: HsdR family type I site-specific deoxyribonuclease [Actinobacteria bacterium]|nr:HsdR family type I site-specific deoxyribonuclease [Actinomycetota bacterium]